MSWGSGAAELAKKIAEYHKELVTTGVRFEELRRQTTETLGEFKSIVERLQESAQARELRHIQEISELKGRIESLHARLDMLSERALHVALNQVAMEKLKQGLSNSADGKLSPPSSRT
jgi:uncharacterized coiled-coil DUF342 family protein